MVFNFHFGTAQIKVGNTNNVGIKSPDDTSTTLIVKRSVNEQNALFLADTFRNVSNNMNNVSLKTSASVSANSASEIKGLNLEFKSLYDNQASVYGIYNSFLNDGNTAKNYGIYNSCIGNGVYKTGIYNSLVGGSSYTWLGINNQISRSSGSSPSDTTIGIRNSINNNNNVQCYGLLSEIYSSQNSGSSWTGILNNLDGNLSTEKIGYNSKLSGSGNGSVTGMKINLNQANGTGSKMGIHLDMLSFSSTENVGIFSSITHSSNTGSGTIKGIKNLLAGTGTGERIGIYNDLQGSSSSSAHTGFYNSIVMQAHGNLKGIYNIVADNSGGDQVIVGMDNSLNGTGTSTKIGYSNSVVAAGTTGSTTGFTSTCTSSTNSDNKNIDLTTNGSGSGVKYGIKNLVNTTGDGNKYGIYNQVITGNGIGNRIGVYSQVDTLQSITSCIAILGNLSTNAIPNGKYAGFFNGKVHVNGTLSKSAGSFMIDHPLDPDNKYLYHSFVESPDMMNIYNGNITTNSEGIAEVILPSYFEALNIDFRYQLTVLGKFAQAIILNKVSQNKFVIKTSEPNTEVSWQVTGIRNDKYAKENRIIPEVSKGEDMKGKLLYK